MVDLNNYKGIYYDDDNEKYILTKPFLSVHSKD